VACEPPWLFAALPTTSPEELMPSATLKYRRAFRRFQHAGAVQKAITGIARQAKSKPAIWPEEFRP